MESSADVSYQAGEGHGLPSSVGPATSLTAGILEHFNYPIVLLDHQLEPVLFNRIAETAGIVNADGQLEASLQTQVSDCTSSAGTLPALVRLKNGNSVLPTLVQVATGSGRSQYLLTSAAPRNATCANVQAVADAYRLTTTEVRILRQLLDGKVPKQIAVTHQVALSTIRTQIKHILQKSGVSSVVDLVLFIKSMPDIKDTTPSHLRREAQSLTG
jgi:DNA-binding CsgD family transcriptional regulator